MSDTTTLLTLTETERRLRAAAKLMRQVNNLPANSKVEIGLRTVDQHMTAEQAEAARQMHRTGESFLPEHDDLDDFRSIEEAARRDEIRTPGYVVHLYAYQSMGFMMGQPEWELYSVCCFWLGDDGPVMISWDGEGPIPTVEAA